MSLTSQLRDKNSRVRQFFDKFEDYDGIKNCLSLLQSTKPIHPSLLPDSASVTSYAYVGTTTDYLIRYAGNGNKLIFEQTIAAKALLRFSERGISNSINFPDDIFHISTDFCLNELFRIAKKNLDGREPYDSEAIYSATALSIMDGVLRSGFLPKLFTLSSLSEKYKEIINGDDFLSDERQAILIKAVFDDYIDSLGGDKYIQDVSHVVKLFCRSREEIDSEVFGLEMIVGNRSLGNSILVGGADFDCIVDKSGDLILVDIKTTTKPLVVEHVRQIIGYALLFDKQKDDFYFDHIGIYNSRSGSFKFLSLDFIMKVVFRKFKSIDIAREKFIEILEKDMQKRLLSISKLKKKIEAAKEKALLKEKKALEKEEMRREKSRLKALLKKERMDNKNIALDDFIEPPSDHNIVI